MTLEWRPLPAGALDHERLWSAVIAAGLATAGCFWLIAGVPRLPCPFKMLTGMPCLTCGATRSLLALAAGDVLAAIRWNPLVPAGAGAASTYLAYAVAVLAAGTHRVRATLAPRESAVARCGAVAALALVWIWLMVDGR